MRQLKITQSITKRSEESLNKYLIEISRMPLISPDQEVELAQTIKKGGKKGEEAKEKLVTSNLRFVVSVAKQYQHQGVPLIDLINEGNIGLITAADKFDETRANRQLITTMAEWKQQLEKFMVMYDYEVLEGAGTVSAEEAKEKAYGEYDKFRLIQDREYLSDFDKEVKNWKELGLFDEQ